jgi:hypothetical protein
MGKRGDGYGSEDHFLRYRAEMPKEFDRLLLEGMGLPDATLTWVYPVGAHGEREPQAISFLTGREDVQTLWKAFWPQRGRLQSWDGVAQLHNGDSVEWLLIEAKANAVEFVSPPSGASAKGGRKQIESALSTVKSTLGVHWNYPWLGTYYQYANRLAFLHFMNNIAQVPARLLHVYFTGDRFRDERECPADAAAWAPLIEARRLTLGLPHKHPLSEHLHEAFIPSLPPVADS